MRYISGLTDTKISQPILTRQHGFTLIELVIIITILGILSAVAIPKYQALDVDAKKSATRASLASLREAINVYKMSNIVNRGNMNWPEIDSLSTEGAVLNSPVPVNPFQIKTNAPDSVVIGIVRGVVVGTRGGWAYKPSTGEIWPNTNTTIPGSGCGGATNINENDW